MAKKTIGPTDRKYRLGLLYIERNQASDNFVLTGAVRGWPSESWDHTCGEPLLYAFQRRVTKQKRFAPNLHLAVVRRDKTIMPLADSLRANLRYAINWKVDEIILNHFSGEDEIRVASRINEVCKWAVAFFVNLENTSKVHPSNWEEKWRHFLEIKINTSSKDLLTNTLVNKSDACRRPPTE